MGNAFIVLRDFFLEFIPALKVEALIIGIGTIIMALCLWEVVWTSGLHGELVYMTLTWGVVIPAILGGILLVFLALTLKPRPRY